MLSWIDDRWHLDGRPIHAGCTVEVRWPDGTWERVRLESADCGRWLFAHGISYHGVEICIRVVSHALDVTYDFRWPGSARVGAAETQAERNV